MLNTLHPDIALAIVGRGLLGTCPAMEANIGRTVRFTQWQPSMGTLAKGTFKIVGVQRAFDGTLCYRICSTAIEDIAGRLAAPSALQYV